MKYCHISIKLFKLKTHHMDLKKSSHITKHVGDVFTIVLPDGHDDDVDPVGRQLLGQGSTNPMRASCYNLIAMTENISL